MAIEISISPPTLTLDEGNEGATTTYKYTLTRTGTEGTALNTYSFVQVRFDAGDTEADDFVGGFPDPTQWVAFTTNEEEQMLEIQVSGDTDIEPNETFSLTLVGAVNADINEHQKKGGHHQRRKMIYLLHSRGGAVPWN
jgi:hypothetical protein